MKGFLTSILVFVVFLAIAQKSPKYEFRAAWVATVSNIDWPSKPGLPVKIQKKEAIELLDLLQSNGMNAVILQIRPSADAIYPSQLEPWSKYLTGKPGVAPTPFYDPLKFWIDECHKRGMEFHAWFNPYRVAQNYKETLAGNHIAFEYPDWVIRYGNRLYFDPGIPETRNFITKVVADVVSRYDLDAIHFDDYFYPYPLKEDFPDSISFGKYNRGYLIEDKADWRRENVDEIIQMLSKSIKNIKPWVKFGISPFGVWRNTKDDPLGSKTNAGTTNYDHLYADVIKWQKEGWIDYLLPQLYWQIGHNSVDFEILAQWWKNHNYNRSMYIGHAAYKIDSKSTVAEWTMPQELPKQIKLLQEIPEINGSAFFSSKHFKRNLLGLQDSLQNNLYKHQAIVPPMPWIDDAPPQPPLQLKKRGKKLKWKKAESNSETDRQIRFVIYKNKDGEAFAPENPEFIDRIIVSSKIKFKRINRKKQKYEIRVSALDRLNNESDYSQVIILKL